MRNGPSSRVNKRATTWALALWLIAVAMTSLFVVLVVLSRGSPGPLEFDTAPLFTALYAVVVLIFSSVGGLIVARRPENRIGWLFSFTGLATITGICAQLYGDQALFDQPGNLPGGEWAVWVSSWLIPAGLVASPIYLLFLFPTGRAPSARWRKIIQALTVLLVFGFLGEMFKPGLIEPIGFGVVNPAGVDGAAGRLIRSLSIAFDAGAIPASILGITSLVKRFHAARGEQRLQFKWFAYVASVMGMGFMGSFLAGLIGIQALADALFITGACGLAAIPIATGLAILRYRLYDIDRIINRTLVYGALTAVLAAIYAFCVVGLPNLLQIGRDSEVLVAASTLLVAALFQPVRRGIQTFIDRRFYRSRYDAAQTTDAFGARLRNEVRLDEVTGDLIGVVHRALQPSHTSLWLAPEGDER